MAANENVDSRIVGRILNSIVEDAFELIDEDVNQIMAEVECDFSDRLLDALGQRLNKVIAERELDDELAASDIFQTHEREIEAALGKYSIGLFVESDAEQ